MRFFRSAGSALLAATVLLGACGGDGNDPTPFDPAGVASDLQQCAGLVDDVFGGDIGDNFFLVADALEGLGGAPTVRASAVTLQRSVTAQDVAAARDGLAHAVKSLVRTGPVTGSAVVLRLTGAPHWSVPVSVTVAATPGSPPSLWPLALRSW